MLLYFLKNCFIVSIAFMTKFLSCGVGTDVVMGIFFISCFLLRDHGGYLELPVKRIWNICQFFYSEL
jgi:hypothetical protein